MIIALTDERTIGRDADPFIPIEVCGRNIAPVGQGSEIAPAFAAPGMDFLDFSDRAILDDFHSTTIIGCGMDLDAHLGDKLFLRGELSEFANFIDVVRERFLDINVFAEMHRGHADGAVHARMMLSQSCTARAVLDGDPGAPL